VPNFDSVEAISRCLRFLGLSPLKVRGLTIFISVSSFCFWGGLRDRFRGAGGSRERWRITEDWRWSGVDWDAVFYNNVNGFCFPAFDFRFTNYEFANYNS
jgi:hypothetical protein